MCGTRHLPVPRWLAMGAATHPGPGHPGEERRDHLPHWSHLHLHARAGTKDSLLTCGRHHEVGGDAAGRHLEERQRAPEQDGLPHLHTHWRCHVDHDLQDKRIFIKINLRMFTQFTRVASRIVKLNPESIIECVLEDLVCTKSIHHICYKTVLQGIS